MRSKTDGDSGRHDGGFYIDRDEGDFKYAM